MARFLKRVSTAESFAGTIVHRHIAIGLRQLVRTGIFPVGLETHGLRDYTEAVEESSRIAKIVRSGKRPPDTGVCLFHHLYGAEDAAAEQRGHQIVERCLADFPTSTAFEQLKDTNYDRWQRILTNSDDVPSFLANEKLGFKAAYGLRVYAAYDLALRIGDEYHIIDWKSGKRSDRSVALAKKQLSVYALWAVAKGQQLSNIRVQAIWLQDDPAWEPQTVEKADLLSAISFIEEQDAFERFTVSPVADQNGEILRYEADRERFEPRPAPATCRWCQYRTICTEGRAATVGA